MCQLLFMLNTEQQQKAINALLKRAENILCADCNAKSPCWASLDFGVFVCMNCSGAHRALGPSVTRVKSTKLDTWNRQWLQNMQVGNSVLNEYWQSQLTGLNRTQKPNVNTPLNQIIKYVHNKYVKRKYVKSGQPIDPLKKQKTNQIVKPKLQKQKEPVSPLINTVKAAKQSDLLSFNPNTVVSKKESSSVVSNLINFQGEVNAPKQNNLLSFQDFNTNPSKQQAQNINPQPINNYLPTNSIQPQNNGNSITFDHLINNYSRPQSHHNHFFNCNQVNQANYYPQNHYQNHYSMQHAFHSISHNSHSLSHYKSPSDNTVQHKQVLLVGSNVWNDVSKNGKITLETNLDWNGENKQKQTVSVSWTDQWK